MSYIIYIRINMVLHKEYVMMIYPYKYTYTINMVFKWYYGYITLYIFAIYLLFNLPSPLKWLRTKK